jgi:hypothetical protein
VNINETQGKIIHNLCSAISTALYGGCIPAATPMRFARSKNM